jgi:predicted nucleotidyltransferase
LNEKEEKVIRKEVGASAVVWYIRHGAVHEQAFEDFGSRMTDELGDNIDRIILYGSVARGEAREQSDVDVLIVTFTTVPAIRKITYLDHCQILTGLMWWYWGVGAGRRVSASLAVIPGLTFRPNNYATRTSSETHTMSSPTSLLVM